MMKNRKDSMGHFLGFLLAAAAFTSCGLQPLDNRGWQAAASNPFWRAAVEPVSGENGIVLPSIQLYFLGYSAVKPGDFASLTRLVSIPAGRSAELSFQAGDNRTEWPSVDLFLEVFFDGKLLFRRDLAGPNEPTQRIRLDLLPAFPERGEALLEFRLTKEEAAAEALIQDQYEFYANLPARGYFIDPEVRTDGVVQKLLPGPRVQTLPRLPAELPLSSLPVNGREWTQNARIIQPWGKTQWDAIVRAAVRAPWLAQEFGFNTIIILPPEAHNAISAPAEQITEQEFQRGLDIYRANGFRIIMYTSIMHCGHAPVWQGGTLERTRPEWSQRGPKGEPIRIYGADWLCPSTGALQYTLEYTAGLVRRYRPDLVMLDNSEFFATPSGVSCHCPGCQFEFRRYLRKRFGDSVAGRQTDTIAIPSESGFLYDLWISWRNRVWGEANEIFRRELRKVKPDLVVMSNTQYLRSSPDLATDLIYDHEDALISESVNMTMDNMINKLLLGRALAKGKPLWNYMGTFRQDNYDLLVPPASIAMNISTAYACGVGPWIVYRGFYEKPVQNALSLDRMASVMAWHNNQENSRSELNPYALVLSLVSLNSRNYRFSRLIPDHLILLRRQGICSWVIEEKSVEQGVPSSCRVLLVEDAPCLSDRASQAIARFVRSGGTVIASSSTARYDELGRFRPKSALWESLGLGNPPRNAVKVGQGEAICLDLLESGDELNRRLKFAQFSWTMGVECSLIPYTDREGNFIVYVCSQQPLPEDLKIIAPGNRHGRAILCVSGQPAPMIVDF
jgi:hypothetical protein